MKQIALFLIIFCCSFHISAQVIINPKGTRITIDSSKWKITGNNIFFKKTGNVGIGTSTPLAQLHTTGSVLFQGIATNVVDTKILTADALGNITTRLISSLPTIADSTTSNNGLTQVGKNIQLGGNLLLPTTISNNEKTFTIATGGAAFNITGLTAGAVTDSILTVNTTTGKINRINLPSGSNRVDSTTANNGLTLTGKNVQLGGNLLQATTITNNANPLTIATGGAALNITGLTAGAATDSILTINTTTGKINRINLPGGSNRVDSTTANNGLTLTGKNVQLGGNLIKATTISNNANPLTIATGGAALNITGLTAGAATDDILVVDGTGRMKIIPIPGDVVPVLAEIYDAAGTQVLTNVFANLNLATNSIVDPGFTVTGGVITVTKAALYKITFRVTAKVTNNVASGGEFVITNAGAAIPGTLGYVYLNNSDILNGTTTIVKMIQLAANSTIAVQGRRYSAVGNLTLTANGSSLLVEKVR